LDSEPESSGNGESGLEMQDCTGGEVDSIISSNNEGSGCVFTHCQGLDGIFLCLFGADATGKQNQGNGGDGALCTEGTSDVTFSECIFRGNKGCGSECSDGASDVALAGGADCLSLTTYSGFNSLRAVDARACRPFRADRAGISLGEGGAVLILETLDHAQSRGARPLAEVLGAASTCDANHMTAPQAEGHWAAVAVKLAIADAGLEPDAIGFVNAHGTGTPLNDAAEFAGLRRVFGERTGRLPIEATKGVVGHLLGAAGAVAGLLLTRGKEIRLPVGTVFRMKFDKDLTLPVSATEAPKGTQ
jgi:hypothetical protein